VTLTLKSTIRIDLHITPQSAARTDKTKRLGAAKKPNRKSKRQRMTLLRRRKAEGKAGPGDDLEMDDEEAEMNAEYGHIGDVGFEDEEEVEEVEER